MRRLTIITIVVIAGLLTTSSRSWAFKVEGHEAIEGLAYARMLSAPPHAACGDSSHVVSGKEILRFLVSIGVLQAPRCFSPRPDSIDARECARDGAERDNWPVLGSGKPDDLYARQLGARGQCYHFMAEPKDVYDHAVDSTSGVHRGLSYDAYERCVQTMYTLWEELLEHPEGSRTIDRGMYALMHAVEDSYSSAHVERDEHWRIQYLKVWDVVSVPYFIHWSGWRYFHKERQHAFDDERDNAWRSGEQSARCPAAATPLELAQHVQCFSPRGVEAAAAVEDLLTTTYCAFRATKVPKMWATHGPHADITPAVRARWGSFVRAHFEPADPNVKCEPDKPLEYAQRERTPDVLFGLRARTQWTRWAWNDGGVGDATIAIHGFPIIRDTYPLVPFLAVEPGLRLTNTKDPSVGFGVETGALVPITGSFAAGLSPIGIESYWNIEKTGYADTALTGHIRLDYFFHDGMWINLASPRFDWINGRFRPELSAAFGYAWEANAADAGATPGYRDDGLDWSPRRVEVRQKPVPVFGAFSVGPQVAPDSGYGVRVVAPEILMGRGSWIEVGGAFLAQTERRDVVLDGKQETVTTSSAGIATRFRVWPVGQRFFALGVTPVQADLGDSSVLSDVFWDVQTNAQATVRFHAFEVSLDSPPLIRWHDERGARKPETQWARDLFIRFGWNQRL